MIYDLVNNKGVIVADTADVGAEVAAEFKEAFGEDLDTADNTPQGLLINAEVLSRQAVARNNALVANQINPNIAEGIWLDAIWALTGGSRRKATRTLVYDVLLTGVPNTIVPEGVIVQSGENQFSTISQVTLNAKGRASVTFQSVELGAIPCPVNTLKQIINNVLGLETVNNPLAGTLGDNEESDQKSRIRRRNTLAIQGFGNLESITSAVYNVDSVRSLSRLENYTDIDMTINGIFLKEHSIWLCVDGGTDTDVANAIFSKKDPGCYCNGNILVEISVDGSPVPYEVRFDRPAEITIYIRVTAKNSSNLDLNTVIPSSIMNYVSGNQEGEEGFVVGSDVSPFELSGAINREYPAIFVKKVELSTDGINFSTNEIAIELDQMAITTSSLISVIQE